MTFGLRIQRIDHPLPGLLTLSGRREEEPVSLLVSFAKGAKGVGLSRHRPRGDSVDAFGRKLRKELGGGRVEEVLHGPEASVVRVKRGDAEMLLVVRHERSIRGAALFQKEGGRPLATLGLPRDEASIPIDSLKSFSSEALFARGAALLRALDEDDIEKKRSALRRRARRALSRRRRKLEAIETDAARAAESPRLRTDATAILSHLDEIERDQEELHAPDYLEGDGRVRVIALSPRLSPKEQAERLFHRARRLDRGAEIAERRWEATAAEIEALEGVAERMVRAEDVEGLEALEAELEEYLTPRERRRDTSAHAASGAEARLPYHRFTSLDGLEIRVGRSAPENDALTLRCSRPHHLWLHARGVSGSHVIVVLPKGKSCPSETLVDAATLAARFSRLRRDPDAEVQYTPRRYVHKRRGAAPGAVSVEREKVIRVTIEPSRLRRLLGGEPLD